MNKERYNKKTIVVQAENFGFGPASIAVSVLKKLKRKGLKGYEVVFMGNGVALELAKLSNDVDRYVNIDTINIEEMKQKKYLLGDVQLFISVVSPTGAIFAKQEGFKVCYIEVLFWYFDNIDKRLLDVDYFFVQKFTDTEKEIKRLDFHHEKLIEVGWIVPEETTKNQLRFLTQKFCNSEEQKIFRAVLDKKIDRYVLINFGGVDNCISEPSLYPEVILKNLIPAIREKYADDQIFVIGGGQILKELRNNADYCRDKHMWMGSVPNEWALYLVAHAVDYFLSCGLSSLIEMGLSRKNGFGLPSQNSSQHMQIKKFRQLYDGWSGFEYKDYDSKYDLPDYVPEKTGVRIIHEAFHAFCSYNDFQKLFVQKVSRYLNSENKDFSVDRKLNMTDISGADEIADLLFSDLHRNDYENYAFAFKADEDAGLFRAEYKCSVEEFVDTIKESSVVYPSRIIDMPLSNGYNNVWIVNRAVALIPPQIDIITGGPCICYCEADEGRLSLQDIMDTTMTVLAAKAWSTDLYLVYTSHEASNQAVENKKLFCFESYDKLAVRIKEYIFKITELIGYYADRIHFVNTSEERARTILDKLFKDYIQKYDKCKLNDLYYFKSKELGEPPVKEDFFLDIYVRNIMMYTPEFFAEYIGRNIESLAVIENQTQSKAIIEGFRYSRNNGYDKFLGHFSFLPFPGITGMEMAHSEEDKGIYLTDSLEEIRKKVSSRMHSFTKQYYLNYLPNEIKAKFHNDDISLSIYEFLNLCKEYMDL